MYVYVMYDNKDTILYVGKTRDMRSRMTQHFGSTRENWKDDVEYIKYMNCYSEVDMSIYEIYFINMFKPKYNSTLLYNGYSYLNLPYKLIKYNENTSEYDDISHEDKTNIKNLLIIYEDEGKSKFNTNFTNRLELKKYNVLSNRWCNKNTNDYYNIIKNASSFFSRVKSKNNYIGAKNLYVGIWDDFFNLKNKNIKYMKNHINKILHKDIKVVCYLRNDYVCEEGSKQVDDRKSILRLVNILKMTAISKGEEVYAYIPSARMRDLLLKYLNGEI